LRGPGAKGPQRLIAFCTEEYGGDAAGLAEITADHLVVFVIE
jgi:hypothetical protein